MPQELRSATIKGTVPLTRSARRIAGHRLFLLGDSTGYVEPFTGEGMAWALTAATAAIPFVVSAIRNSWSDELVRGWQSSFHDITHSAEDLSLVVSNSPTSMAAATSDDNLPIFPVVNPASGQPDQSGSKSLGNYLMHSLEILGLGTALPEHSISQSGMATFATTCVAPELTGSKIQQD